LPGIKELAPAERFYGEFQIRRFIDDAGTFASHFEHYRRQMNGGGLRNDSPDTRTSRVMNKIEPFRY
jgi:hypothetical protein